MAVVNLSEAAIEIMREEDLPMETDWLSKDEGKQQIPWTTSAKGGDSPVSFP